jgi:hypothetical protein
MVSVLVNVGIFKNLQDFVDMKRDIDGVPIEMKLVSKDIAQVTYFSNGR